MADRVQKLKERLKKISEERELGALTYNLNRNCFSLAFTEYNGGLFDFARVCKRAKDASLSNDLNDYLESKITNRPDPGATHYSYPKGTIAVAYLENDATAEAKLQKAGDKLKFDDPLK